VIPFRAPRTVHAPMFFSTTREKRWALRMDCLIESQVASDIHKMAFELHSRSRRFAFVQYADLDRTSRLNLSELIAMGEVSLFVPDILQLAIDEQKVLAQLAVLESEGRPLLMVGARRAYSDLRAEAAIFLEFLMLLARAYIKMTRPFSEYKENGLIHY